MSVAVSANRLQAGEMFVQEGMDITQIAHAFNLQTSTIKKWKQDYKWVKARQKWLNENPISYGEARILLKNRERARTYETIRIKTQERINELKSTDASYETKMTRLLVIYDKSVLGERREDGQTTTVKKEVVEDKEDNSATIRFSS
jgi:transposase